MSRAASFKPGLRNFYLVQAPHRVSGEPALAISTIRGKAGDRLSYGIPMSADYLMGKAPKDHYAFLGQHHCETEADVIRIATEYHKTWVRQYDLTPVPAQKEGAAS